MALKGLRVGACFLKMSLTMSLTMVLKIFKAVFTSGADVTGSQFTFSKSTFIDVGLYDL